MTVKNFDNSTIKDTGDGRANNTYNNPFNDTVKSCVNGSLNKHKFVHKLRRFKVD